MFASLQKPLTIFGLTLLLLLLGAVAASATPSPRIPAQETTGPADNAPVAISSPVDDTFTYQGILEHDGAPVNDACDFRFSLWDAAQEGSQIGAIDQQQLPVSDGAFTAVLNEDGDFGDAPFNGQARWLEIDVRCPAGSGNYVILVPRQPLTPAPYALSLRPGATISGTVPAQRGALNLTSDNHGLLVTSAGGDGVQVCATGSETACSPHDGTNNGLEVGSAEDMGVLVDSAHTGIFLGRMREDGLYVGAAADDGMRVFEAGGTGISVNHAGEDGFFVCSTGTESSCPPPPIATNNGLEIGSAEDYGVYVDSAGEAGVFVASAPGGVLVNEAIVGVLVGGTDDDGMAVWSAGGTGVYANTTNDLGQWGFSTSDQIRASGFTMQTMTLVAQVGGDTALQAGDLVGAAGVAGPLPDGRERLAVVVPAATGGSIAGVVESRLVLEPKERPDETSAESAELWTLYSAPGPARPGDYVALTIAGVAQVRVDSETVVVEGQRLTVASGGAARPLETRTVEGMVVTEGLPTVGTALSAPDARGLVWVLVNLQ